MPLDAYRKKRKFDGTPEPPGRVRRASRRELAFVVQKHDATRLHYDFRLQAAGVMHPGPCPKAHL